jgi:hypothetical protein
MSAVRTQMGLCLQPVFHVVTVLPSAFFEQRVGHPCDFLLRWLDDSANRFFHKAIPLRVLVWLTPVIAATCRGQVPMSACVRTSVPPAALKSRESVALSQTRHCGTEVWVRAVFR